MTVLFADVSGSMDLAAALDPEEWAEVVDRLAQVLAAGVTRFAGTVDKFTGDGVMALFGAPVSLEDHAARACHAARHLQEAAAAYAARVRDRRGVEVAVRIGLHSGEVVVGPVGDEGGLGYTALGHVVGLAQRMESLAGPGEVFLTGATARLLAGRFTLADLGARPVKGSPEPVAVFALGEPVSRRRPVTGVTGLVGRSSELGVLEAALARALDGDGGVIGVVGDAGVGKSRLCDEFARSVAERGITVRRAAGLSHATAVPLLPVLELLRDYFGIADADSRAAGRAKVTGRLLDLDPAFEEDLPLLVDFLDLAEGTRPPLSPEVRLERVVATFRRVAQRRSAREPLVLILEDLHWFDPQSVAFWERILPIFPATRTLVLTNFRPEFRPPWGSRRYYSQLSLQPLAPAAAARLVAQLLGDDPECGPLAELITERTGGYPFFAEEVVRALADDGTLVGGPVRYRPTRPVTAITVPPTVQAALAARIDRLADADKAVLQMASVIGRTFTGTVLRAVAASDGSDLGSGMAGALERLCAVELLTDVSRGPDEEYRFWHPLTQEVAAAGLLRERRRRLHGAVARALIDTGADQLDQRAPLVADHFAHAGEALEAARWSNRAGDAQIHQDLDEAISRWRQTLAHLDAAPPGDDASRLGLWARARLIRYLTRTRGPSDDTATLEREVRAAAEQLGDALLSAMVAVASGGVRLWRGDVADAVALYAEAATLADQHGDPDVRAAGWAAVAAVRAAFVGSLDEAAEAAGRLEAIVGDDPRAGRALLGISPIAVLHAARAELLRHRGATGAQAELDTAAHLARDHHDEEWHVWSLAFAAHGARTTAELERALDLAEEGIRLAREFGNTAQGINAAGAAGAAEVGLGRHAQAAERLSGALADARHRRLALFEEARLLANLARARLGLGDNEAARAGADEAVAVARRQGARLIEIHALLTRARIGRATGAEPAVVRADLDAARTLALATGAIAYVAEADTELTSPTPHPRG